MLIALLSESDPRSLSVLIPSLPFLPLIDSPSKIRSRPLSLVSLRKSPSKEAQEIRYNLIRGLITLIIIIILFIISSIITKLVDLITKLVNVILI